MLWGRNEWVGQFVAGRRGAEDESCRQEIDRANKVFDQMTSLPNRAPSTEF